MTTPSLAHYLFTPWTASGDRRIIAGESHWREPIAWNLAAQQAGERPRVLVGCEMFEDWQGPLLDENGEPLFTVGSPRQEKGDLPGEVIQVKPIWPAMISDVRQRLLIAATPHLDWLIATEKPENVPSMMATVADAIGSQVVCPTLPPNVWLGVIVSTQAEWDARVPALLKVPSAKRWVWFRDLKEDINMTEWLGSKARNVARKIFNATIGAKHGIVSKPDIDWLALSGSTGPDAPPTDLANARSIVRQGQSAGVPVWVDCLGSRPVTQLGKWESRPGHTGPLSPVQFHGDGFGNYHVTGLRDPDGRDMSEFPINLQVRQEMGE